jgi:hypothetical protein
MTSLAQLQHDFQAYVLGADSAVAASVTADARASAETRLRIYEDAYHVRLEEALGVTYPAVRNAMGPQAFAECVRNFSLVQPSSFRSIRYYGAALSDFLAAQVRGVRGQGLGELAHWEWLLADAFDGEDSQVVALSDLASIDPADWPRLQFDFVPTLRRISISTNAVRWWRERESTATRRWRRQRAVEWMIWRRDLKVHFRSLAADETHALQLAVAGETFAAICKSLEEFKGGDEGFAALRAATLLRDWIQEGLIANVRLV